MVLVVFRSRIRAENAEEFLALAAELLEIAESMPGFVAYKNFRSDDGERCSVIEFESVEHLRGWREHPEHRLAQRIGRERFYTEYSLHVAEPTRESRFERPLL